VTIDLLIKGGILPDGTQADIAITGDRITAVEAGITAEAGEVIEATGKLVSTPFVDPHFHMDATLSYGLPRINASGTLLEGIQLWGELKPLLTVEAVVGRALKYCRIAVGKGLLSSTCNWSPSRRTAGFAVPARHRTWSGRWIWASTWSEASRISSVQWPMGRHRCGRPASWRRNAG
jgi:cytosine/adenosine deaminase-related metal-dependent hydrolase